MKSKNIVLNEQYMKKNKRAHNVAQVLTDFCTSCAWRKKKNTTHL